VLPEHAEELTVPAQKRLRLDKKERLFPGPNHCGLEHQEESVRLAIDRPFDLSTETDQLVSQQRVFRQQFSFAFSQIGKRAEHQGGHRRFDPTQNPFLEHMKAGADSSLDRGKHSQHKQNLFFMKTGAWSERTRSEDLTYILQIWIKEK
jgi:hypothetical protein